MIRMEYWNIICISIIVGMLAILAIESWQLENDSFSRSENAVLYMSALFIGMGVCLILFASVFLDKRVSSNIYFFMCIISLEFICLFIEFQYWYVRFADYGDILLQALYYGEDLVFPMVICMFVNYQKGVLSVDDGVFLRIRRFMDYALVFNLGLLLANIPTGWFFEIDDKALHYGPLVFALYVPCLLMVGASIYMTARFSKSRRHRLAFLTYVLIPIVAMCAHLPSYSASLTYLAALVSFIFIYGEIYLNRGIKIAQNEADITEQKIAMMVSRIEPQFLDEALRSIMSLEGNPEETRTAVDEFRRYIDSNLQTLSKIKPVEFTEELEHVKTYLNLEHLRFKDKLKVVYDIRCTDFQVPVMTLQMIVENAVKHGITQKEQGGTVSITTEELPQAYRITVEDDGVGFDTDTPRDLSRSHIGMANISSRIREMMNGTFTVESTPGTGTTATVEIPKKK